VRLLEQIGDTFHGGGGTLGGGLGPVDAGDEFSDPATKSPSVPAGNLWGGGVCWLAVPRRTGPFVAAEDAMHPAPEPSRSAPASQAVPDTGLTAPHMPESPSSSALASMGPEAPASAPLPVADGLPAQVGRYHIQGEIARGGMGIVLRAQDRAFHRTLAVKMLLQARQPQLKQRFLEEAQILGQLQHPGIPPVHDLGELPDGRPFFAMKLIKGHTLAALLKERPDPAHDLPQFLAIFGQVCQAVAYAHSRGVLHRDLKPSNIMVGAFGEVQVMDWGLAKVLGSPAAAEAAIQTEELSTIATVRTAEDELATQDGAVLGTPAYMAPEQARGEIERLDERADVFGLGAILCVVLTGQPPFTNLSALDLLVQTAVGELTDAYRRLDACGADEELSTLAKRCLAPLVEERPRDAGEVAAAVAAYQAQVQERLRQAEVERARAQEERKRRRLRLALAGVVLLLVAGVAAAGWWYQQQQAQRALDQAERDGEKARQALRQEQAVGEIKAALHEGEQLRQRALTLLDRPESWKATLTSARSAWQRAQALLQQEPQLAATAPAQQIEQLRVSLAEDDQDYQLWTAFEQVRFKLFQYDPRYRDAEAYHEVRGALSQWGLRLGEIPAERATTLLKQRPRPMQDRLVSLLYFCLLVGPADQKQQALWLGRVLTAVDRDPWRQQMRQALLKADGVLLIRLLDQLDVAQQPPMILVQLANTLQGQRHPALLLFLRRAQQRYPGDFWLNAQLGQALYHSVFSGGIASRAARAEELARVTEAVGFWRVAVGVRPGSGPAHHNLAAALAAQGDLPGAIACYRQALQLNPKLALAWNNLAIALEKQGDGKGAIACYQKTIELDPNLAVAHNNLGLALKTQGNLPGAIACFKKALDLDPREVQAHLNLGNALYAQKDLSGAIACFRQALKIDPKDASSHIQLGRALADQKNLPEALACFRQAVTLDPKDAKAHYNLGTALHARKDLPGAVACFRQALKLDPRYAKAHAHLGRALQDQQDLPGAIACYHKALELDPKLVSAHYFLGMALQAKEDLPGAIACYRKALDLDPKDAASHNNLGTTLLDQGDLKGAIACFRKAIDFDSKYVVAHFNLGTALYANKDLSGAIASFRRVLALDPKHTAALNNLGAALRQQGDLAGAIACFRQARDLQPKNAHAHYNLGLTLDANKDLAGSIACYTRAIDLDPKYAEAHCNLGHALRQQGHFARALQALQRGHQLGSSRPGWPYPSAQWVEDCQRLLDLDSRLSAILKGEDQPRDSAEQLALADLCQRYKKRYATALRFYEDAFAAKPELPSAQHQAFRYNAACAAVLAAAGKGEDASNLEGKEQSRLRQQALAWLREALKLHTQQLENADAKGRAAVQQVLQHWQRTGNLESVRREKALAQLSEAERAAWQTFWADLEKVHKKAGAKP
jgi:tetratricopeptide (TPR) repeat protein